MSGVGTLIGGKAADALEAPVIETIIRPRRGWIAIDWRELIQQRELLYFLTMRDIKVRYKQTVLGVAWAVLQPVLMMVIFTLIFGRLAGIPSNGLPYAVFVYAGLLPWTFVSTSVNQAGLSLVNQQSLLTKIYLPRVFVPASSVAGALVDFGISFLVFLGLMFCYGIVPGIGALMLPALVAISTATALGIGLALAALTVSYRDFRYVIPLGLQIWMFISPVIYAPTLVPERFRWLLLLNPMTGVIDGFRAAFLGTDWDWRSLGIAAVVSAACLVFGLYYFRRAERRFADIA